MKFEESKLKEIIRNKNARIIVGNGIHIGGKGILLLGRGKTTISMLVALFGGALVGDDYIAWWKEPSSAGSFAHSQYYMCSYRKHACGPFLRNRITDKLERDERLDYLIKERDTYDIREFTGREDSYKIKSQIDYAILMLWRELPRLDEYLSREELKKARRGIIKISTNIFLDMCDHFNFTALNDENLKPLISDGTIETYFTSIESSWPNKLETRARKIIEFVEDKKFQ